MPRRFYKNQHGSGRVKGDSRLGKYLALDEAWQVWRSDMISRWAKASPNYDRANKDVAAAHP